MDATQQHSLAIPVGCQWPTAAYSRRCTNPRNMAETPVESTTAPAHLRTSQGTTRGCRPPPCCACRPGHLPSGCGPGAGITGTPVAMALAGASALRGWLAAPASPCLVGPIPATDPEAPAGFPADGSLVAPTGSRSRPRYMGREMGWAAGHPPKPGRWCMQNSPQPVPRPA